MSHGRNGGHAARKAVAAANRRFYRAFEALDLAAMEDVWHDAPAVVCVHPGSDRLVGRAQVMASWEAIFEATGSIRFELADLSVEVAGSMGIAGLVERITSNAGEISEAVATNVFVLTDDGWRMMVHHASPIMRRLT